MLPHSCLRAPGKTLICVSMNYYWQACLSKQCDIPKDNQALVYNQQACPDLATLEQLGVKAVDRMWLFDTRESSLENILRASPHRHTGINLLQDDLADSSAISKAAHFLKKRGGQRREEKRKRERKEGRYISIVPFSPCK